VQWTGGQHRRPLIVALRQVTRSVSDVVARRCSCSGLLVIGASEANRVGDKVWVSGQVGIDLTTGDVPADMTGQARLAFAGVQSVLEAAGATLGDIVELMTFTPTCGVTSSTSSRPAWRTDRSKVSSPMSSRHDPHAGAFRLPPERYGAVSVLIGPRSGAYPHANTLLVPGRDSTLVIDPSLTVASRAPSADVVLVSHGHEDHIAGLSDYDGPIHAHHGDLRAVRSPAALVECFGFTSEDAVATECILRADFRIEDRPEATALADGEVFDLGGRTVTVVHLPGHTPGTAASSSSLTGCCSLETSTSRPSGRSTATSAAALPSSRAQYAVVRTSRPGGTRRPTRRA